MARRYGDEDFDHLVVRELVRLGHDVLTVQEAGQGNQGTPDAEVLASATSQGRAVLTFNRRHFIHLHHRTRPHCGILVCTRDVDSPALATRIHEAILNCPGLDDQLLRINRPPGA